MIAPDVILDETHLDDVLSTPSTALIAAAQALSGTTAVIGPGGKMGVAAVHRLHRALEAAGTPSRILCVSRFTNEGSRFTFDRLGVETIAADMLDQDQVDALPDADRVFYMVGRKFDTTGNEHLTWATNVLPPVYICRRYAGKPVIAISTGSVYAFTPVLSGGSTEQCPLEPRGEYANAAVARERLFQWAAHRYNCPTCLIRLFYANDLRYGVLRDIADSIVAGEQIDLSTGFVNLIWQGDAVDQCLRAFPHATLPVQVLNVTGPETISVRQLAERLGALLGKEPVFANSTLPDALLGNASRAASLFGYPEVTLETMIQWTKAWVEAGRRGMGKRTQWECRNGRY